MNKIFILAVCLLMGVGNLVSASVDELDNKKLVAAIREHLDSLKAEQKDFIAKSNRFAEKDPQIPGKARAMTSTINEIADLYEKIIAEKTGKSKTKPAVSYMEQLRLLNQRLLLQTNDLNAAVALIKKNNPEWALSEANKNALNALAGLQNAQGNLADDWVLIEK